MGAEYRIRTENDTPLLITSTFLYVKKCEEIQRLFMELL
jgi:hypothetical protein